MTDSGRPHAFDALFGRPFDVAARAPGRVNLIGEHTDYNGGYVLPMAIPQTARVELACRDDATVRAWSASIGGLDAPLEYALGAEARGRGWLDYVQGVTHALRTGGHATRGFDVRIESDVPLGSGLSSSAAFAVAVLRALRAAFGLALDDVALALLAQRAETEFVGAPVGAMDPLAASLASQGTALFLDTRSLAYEQVALPRAAELVVIDSGVAHAHAAGDYRTRRAECEQACALLGVAQLRDLTEADLPRVAALPEPLARRARHVVTEIARVPAAVEAMRVGDAARLGELFEASHASQRDDFEVSVPEIDLLVDIARAEPGVHGARLTGGGFGGSVVILAHRRRAGAVAASVAKAYAARSERTPTVLVPRSVERLVR